MVPSTTHLRLDASSERGWSSMIVGCRRSLRPTEQSRQAAGWAEDVTARPLPGRVAKAHLPGAAAGTAPAALSAARWHHGAVGSRHHRERDARRRHLLHDAPVEARLL